MVPGKDPDRNGREWYENGRNSTSKRIWDREQEIMFGVAAGGLIYREWSPRIHHLIDAIRLNQDWLFFAGVDPGVSVTAALWYAITPEGYHFLIDEYYAGDSVINTDTLSATEHALAIRNRTQVLCDRTLGLTKGGSSRKDGQAWIQTTLIDPSAWRRDNDLSVVAQRYLDAGVTSLMEGARDVPGGIERVKELELRRPGVVHPNGMEDDGAGFPIKYSYPHLMNYYREKKRYKCKPGTDEPQANQDHLMDCERYLCVHVRERPYIDRTQQMTEMGKRMARLREIKRGNTRYDNL